MTPQKPVGRRTSQEVRELKFYQLGVDCEKAGVAPRKRCVS